MLKMSESTDKLRYTKKPERPQKTNKVHDFIFFLDYNTTYN